MKGDVLMIKVTQKDIRNLSEQPYCVNVTNCTPERYSDLRVKEGYFEPIMYSVGTYGVNGRVVRGHNTGTLYAISRRSSAIYLFY